MAPRRKVTQKQMEILLDYVELNVDLAMGRLPAGGYLGIKRARRLWEAVANDMNSLGEGAIKSPEQWKRYWIEYKSRIKVKAADSRRSSVRAEDGHNQLAPLDPLEERALAIMSSVPVEGSSGVQGPSTSANDDRPIVTPRRRIHRPRSKQKVGSTHQDESTLGSTQGTGAASDGSMSNDDNGNDKNIESWAYDLEQRQFDAQERLIEVAERQLAGQQRLTLVAERVVEELQKLTAAVKSFKS